VYFTLAYVGESNADFVASISDAKRHNKSRLFYRWYPDPLVTLVGGVRVAFPDYSMACIGSHDAASVSKSGVTCDLETDDLQSLYRKDLPDIDKVLHAFLQKIIFAADEIEEMLKQLRGAGGTSSVDEAACNWVKANVDRWKFWVPEAGSTGPCTSTEYLDSDSGACIDCPASSFRNNSESCPQCPSGSYNPKNNAENCVCGDCVSCPPVGVAWR
jgi:hypothetical protein